MKKIVPKLLVISSQISIGALFLIFTICSKSETTLKVNSVEMKKLSKFVYEEKINKFDVKDRNDLVEDSFNKFEKEDIKKDNKTEDNNKIINDNYVEEINETIDNSSISDLDNYFMDRDVLTTYTGVLTGYGPDCVGCGNYNTSIVATASGYHIADIVDGVIQPAFTVTYNDSEFGEVRIVAADSTIPFNTIVRITIPNEEPILAIVLDRGSTVGFENCRSPKGCLTMFDLLYPTESSSLGKTYNVTFEILRMGL